MWQRRAAQIPDRTLREAALDALLTKGDVLEGAAAFVVLTPPPIGPTVCRAITAFEIAFDYLDTIMEFPNPNPIANGHCLGQALLAAFEARTTHADYYAYHPQEDDAGYLEALVDTCRTSVQELPSFALITHQVRHALLGIVRYQSLNHGSCQNTRDSFTLWARSQIIPGIDLNWWEVGAATGSQLIVLALIAAAADPMMQAERVDAIERAYVPWIGALSTLLDSVVDQHADRTHDCHSLVDNYCSPQATAERLRLIAIEAQRAILPLADATDHSIILVAMAAFFHSTQQASIPEVGLVTRAVLDTIGGSAIPALILLRARRTLGRVPPRYLATISHR